MTRPPSGPCSPDAWAEVRPPVEAADFVDEGCAWCYEAAQSLADRSARITMQTLAQELECAGRSGGSAASEASPRGSVSTAAPPPPPPPARASLHAMRSSGG